MINEQFKLDGKIRNGSFLKVKTKLRMFEGQYDLEDQGQGHQFSNSSETLFDQNNMSEEKVSEWF